MTIDECFQLGYVIKTHGLKGEINVLIDADDPNEYKNLESVFVEINKKLVPFFIDRIQIRGGKAIVKLEDLNTIEQAEELKSCSLYLPLSFLPELEEGQFYYHEIIGYEVVDDTLGTVGKVKNVYELPNQDLIAIDYKGKEALIPVNDDLIGHVDHEAKTLAVSLPEGLLDIYLE